MSTIDEHGLISMICVGEAGATEWEAFERLASASPDLWRALAEAQRDQAALSAAVDDVVRLADRIDLPFAATNEDSVDLGPGSHWRLPRAAAWSGWAVAAAVGAAWLIGLNANAPVPPASANASLVDLASLSSDDLLRSYVDKGRASGAVIGEVPAKVLIGARPSRTGQGYELLYLRQMVEQTAVPELYRLGGEDERGRSTLVRYTPEVRRPM